MTTGALAVTRASGLYLNQDITTAVWVQLGSVPATLVMAAFNPADPGAGILASDASNVYFYNPRTQSDWTTVLTQAQIIAVTGKPSFTIGSVAISPVTGYYYVGGADPLTNTYNRVWRSVNGGTTWTQVALTRTQNRGVSGLVCANADGQLVYAAEAAGSTLTRCAVSANGGTTFTQYNLAGFGGWIPLLFVDPDDDSRLYAGTAGPVLSVSTNGGQTWAAVYAVSGPVANSSQSWLWVDPDNSDKVYFTYGDYLHYTHDQWATAHAQALPTSYTNYNALVGENAVLWLGRATATSGDPHSIYRTADYGATMTAWSGANDADPAATDSIPYTASGITLGGLAFITTPLELSAVTISGADSIPACLQLTLTASVTPPVFADYVTWAWSTDGLQSGQGTDTAVYMWDTARAAYPQVTATYGALTVKGKLTVSVLHNPQCLHYAEDLLTLEVHG